jgi:hypothetical protein
MKGLPKPRSDSHPRYTQLCSARHVEGRRGRDFVADLFERSAAYLDPSLAHDLPTDFPSRFWEMYVTAMLLDSGIALRRSVNRPIMDGPDLLVEDGTTWVEAVAAGPGLGADALVWPANYESAFHIPDERIKLRLLSALKEKQEKGKKYFAAGIVGPDHRYMVALNAGEVPLARTELHIPRILRTLFPIGPMEVVIDISSGAVTGSRYAYNRQVFKENGSAVATDSFLSPTSAPVSAVLYACVDEYNWSAPLGDAILLVHNPSATNRLPDGFMKCGREYLPGDQVIDVRDHRRVA